jgi:hypothetical protein
MQRDRVVDGEMAIEHFHPVSFKFLLIFTMAKAPGGF